MKRIVIVGAIGVVAILAAFILSRTLDEAAAPPSSAEVGQSAPVDVLMCIAALAAFDPDDPRVGDDPGLSVPL